MCHALNSICSHSTSSSFCCFFFIIILLLSADYFSVAQTRKSQICIYVVSRVFVCVYSAYASIFSISSYNLQPKWQIHNEMIWDIIGKRQLDLCVCIQMSAINLLCVLRCMRNRIDECIVLFLPLLYCMDGHRTRMYAKIINRTSTVINISRPTKKKYQRQHQRHQQLRIWLNIMKCRTTVVW